MKTQEELIIRIREVADADMFGFEIQHYIERLEWKHARTFLEKEVREEDWRMCTLDPVDELKSYMPFAWEKANNFRGLSAMRSMAHMRAWLWLSDIPNRHDLIKSTEDDYEYYGKPQLVEICKAVGLDPDEWDDKVRLNSEPEFLDPRDNI